MGSPVRQRRGADAAAKLHAYLCSHRDAFVFRAADGRYYVTEDGPETTHDAILHLESRGVLKRRYPDRPDVSAWVLA